MLNLTKILRENRLCKAITGCSIEEFNALLIAFEAELYIQKKERPNRKRAIGGGCKGKLPTSSYKLAFILIYLKVYPTYDLFGMLTDRARSKCCESVQKFLPILERVLGKACVLPKRKISSMKEFIGAFGSDVKDLFIDGSERVINRPKNAKQQRKLYSGKKKKHTKKNIVCADEKRRILIMGPTKSGRRHDKRLLDKMGLLHNIPKDCAIWGDTGFEGISEQHKNTQTPHKRKKGKPLTTEQKEENKVISSFRVVVEHAIGGYKRFNAASAIYRSKKPKFDDKLHLIAAGLWNFHLKQTS